MHMSGRLHELLIRVLTEKGTTNGKKKLGQKVGKSGRTIHRWLKEGIPTTHDAYMLALACGCTKDEALVLANEGHGESAKKAS